MDLEMLRISKTPTYGTITVRTPVKLGKKVNVWGKRLFKIAKLQVMFNYEHDVMTWERVIAAGWDIKFYFNGPNWFNNLDSVLGEHRETHEHYLKVLPIKMLEEHFETESGESIPSELINKLLPEKKDNAELITYTRYKLENVLSIE